MSNKTKLSVFKVSETATLPMYATEQSACFDLSVDLHCMPEVFGKNYSPCSKDFHGNIYLYPGMRYKIPTGLIFDIPEGYKVEIYARSGTALKKGLIVINAPAQIDSDYVEETFVLIENTSDTMQTLSQGERFAQAALVQVENADVLETKERPAKKTSRNGGFNSTGVGAIIDKTYPDGKIKESFSQKMMSLS